MIRSFSPWHSLAYLASWAVLGFSFRVLSAVVHDSWLHRLPVMSWTAALGCAWMAGFAGVSIAALRELARLQRERDKLRALEGRRNDCDTGSGRA